MQLFLFPLLLLISGGLEAQDPVRWRVARSLVEFTSEAPLERITATNTKAVGLLDLQSRSFAVQIPMAGFQGFNAPLQREHFNENYMASRDFPHATFAGRIIESVDLAVPGTHSVRAKGKLEIRGVSQERIIPCMAVVTTEGVRITTTFDVALDQHEIRVPRVVQQKIASVVSVSVDVLFKPSP